jgi:hypothetical protein
MEGHYAVPNGGECKVRELIPRNTMRSGRNSCKRIVVFMIALAFARKIF